MKFICILLTGALLLCTGCGRQSQVYLSTEETEYTTEETLEIQNDTEKKQELLYVYVCGAVHNPGVFSFQEGMRVCDAIAAAGGFLENARQEYWNQAMVLTDGQMIYVPTIEEETIPSNGTDGSQTESKDTRININTATKEELMTVPGIGEAKAESILAYRQENGNFISVEDIMQVAGIKEALFGRIKNYIRVN